MQGYALVFVIAVVTGAFAAVIVFLDWDLAVIRAWHALADPSARSGRSNYWANSRENHPWAPSGRRSDWPAPEPAVETETWRADVIRMTDGRAGEPAMSLREALELRRAEAQQESLANLPRVARHQSERRADDSAAA